MLNGLIFKNNRILDLKEKVICYITIKRYCILLFNFFQTSMKMQFLDFIIFFSKKVWSVKIL